jgi:hypothetical protein
MTISEVLMFPPASAWLTKGEILAISMASDTASANCLAFQVIDADRKTKWMKPPLTCVEIAA